MRHQHPGRRRRRAGTKRSRPTAASPSFLKAREVVLVYRPFPAFAVRISLYGACGLRVCFGAKASPQPPPTTRWGLALAIKKFRVGCLSLRRASYDPVKEPWHKAHGTLTPTISDLAVGRFVPA